jgi:signal transduction histidine kinase
MNEHNVEEVKKRFGRKLQIAIVLLFILVMCINFLWTYHYENQELIEIATEKADIIVREYITAIEFAIQGNNSYENNTGSKNSVHKRILSLGEAGRQFSKRLSVFADFKIKMISINPRNKNNTPDEYEKEALTAFGKEHGLENMFKEVRINDKSYLRYLAPLKITKSCLGCHGEPAGEIDVTGYQKEGYKEGDIKSAVSLTLPLYTEYKHMKRHLMKLIIFYLVITMIAAAAAFFILKKMVNLNKEIYGKNIQLKKQHDILKAYEKEKATLIEMIVHDLNNPLTSITSGLESALINKGIMDDKLNSILKISFSSAERMAKMISDILDISTLESKKFTPNYKTLDLMDFMNETFGELRLSLKDKVKSLDLVFKNDLPVFVADASLLKRVFENIIYNAVKHSPPKNAEITAAAEYLASDDEVLISISDKGEGILDEHLDKIFDKFYKVGSKGDTRFNKGMGLAFCRFAVDLMGGRIWAENNPDKGATFHFTLKSGYEGQKGYGI